MKSRLSRAILALAAMFCATAAVAAAITFTMSVPGASGSNNGVPFSNQTVSISVHADTTQVTSVASIGGSGQAGHCVPATSASISVGGGPLAVAAPVFFCATTDAFITGVFTTSNAAASTWYFIADYSNAGITNFALASSFPLTSNVPGDTANTASPLNLVGGGTASITTVPSANTTFSATLGGSGGGSIAKVPTLSAYALMLLSASLLIAGAWVVRRPRRASADRGQEAS